MVVDSHSARMIAEDLLARTADAMKNSVFDAFSACFTMPTVIETFEGRSEITSTDAFRKKFEDVTSVYQRMGVTDHVRNCLEAKFAQDDLIISTHEARLMHGAQLLQRPYPVMSHIKWRDGAWKIAFSSYAVEDNTALTDALIRNSVMQT